MASATTRLTTFSFHHLSTQPSSRPQKPHLLLSRKPLPPTVSFNIRFKPHKRQLHFATNSVDVSKEDSQDTPTSDPPVTQPQETSTAAASAEEEVQFDKRRLEEKFAVLNTGIYECRSCGFKYDEAVGDPSYPIPPGFQFDKLPDDWRCPTCGAAKSFFQSKSVEIAGFAQNMQYGLGGNALTSGQKAIIIYGSLFLFFLLFLSGYFLQ